MVNNLIVSKEGLVESSLLYHKTSFLGSALFEYLCHLGLLDPFRVALSFLGHSRSDYYSLVKSKILKNNLNLLFQKILKN